MVLRFATNSGIFWLPMTVYGRSAHEKTYTCLTLFDVIADERCLSSLLKFCFNGALNKRLMQRRMRVILLVLPIQASDCGDEF